LFTFLFVYERGFNAYAIFIAKDREKKSTKKIIDENGIPLLNYYKTYLNLIKVRKIIIRPKYREFGKTHALFIS
jgi:hypothetical protein